MSGPFDGYIKSRISALDVSRGKKRTVELHDAAYAASLSLLAPLLSSAVPSTGVAQPFPTSTDGTKPFSLQPVACVLQVMMMYTRAADTVNSAESMADVHANTELSALRHKAKRYIS